MKKVSIVLLCAAAISIHAQTPQNITSNGNNLLSTEYIGTNNNADLVIKTNGLTNTIFDKYGHVTFNGNHTVAGNQLISGNHKVVGNQEVLGTLTSHQGIMFDANIGLKYYPSKAGGARESFYLGSGDFEPLSSICPTPDPNYIWFATQGAYISRIAPGTAGAASLVDASLTMMTAPWNGSGYIEIQGKDDHGDANNAFFVNYFCGRNTYINTNNGLENHGGKVFLGERVSMAKSVGIGSNYPNENFEDNTALNVFANEDDQTALKLNVWNGSVKAIDLVDPSNPGESNFSVAQNGAIKSKYLGGSGVRSVLADQDGNLLTGIAPNTWSYGGNAISTPTNYTSEYIGTSSASDFVISTTAQPRMVVKADGKIVVGQAPSNSDYQFSVQASNYGAYFFTTQGSGSNSNKYVLKLETQGSNETDLIQGYSNFGTPAKVFQVKYNGETHIGDLDQMPKTQLASLYKLVVGGRILGQAMRVTMTNWADYVFDDAYKLPTIKTVEEYIAKNKHLPEIPTTEEVVADGLDLGEMNKLLLKKLEENTLYIIQLNQRVDALEKELQTKSNGTK